MPPRISGNKDLQSPAGSGQPFFRGWAAGLAAAGLLLVTLAAQGAAGPPAPVSLVVENGQAQAGGITLTGPDADWQLLVTGHFANGAQRDLTREAAYTVTPAGTVAVDRTGLVTALKEGTATIQVAGPGGRSARVQVTVKGLREPPPVSFVNEVVPTFTRFGCNAGGCHGKASGRNGFKLSLFGFEPAEDYEFLVKEGRGRRLFPAAPAYSLLLRKPTAALAHGGGKRLDASSPSYRLLLRWIAQGALYDPANAPAVERIEVLPKERRLPRDAEQQLAVLAHYSNGSVRDVTRLAQFESNNNDIAAVSPTGLVHVREVPGVVAVMARFQTHVAVFRAAVPLGAPVAELPPAKNFIDELVFKQLKDLGLPPSPLCDDATFLRRVTIDIAGRLPTLQETRDFLAEKSTDRYGRLVDRLLNTSDYADYFAGKWGAILRNRRRSATENPRSTLAFHRWIRDSLARNKPYDQLVREVLTAAGEGEQVPQILWLRETHDPAGMVEDAAQLFLGQRLQCAKCHHHPQEKWTQDDYYGLAAFFSRVVVKEAVLPKKAKKKKKGPEEPAVPGAPLKVYFSPGRSQMTNPRSLRPVPPAGLGARPLEIAANVDPRGALADWMTARDNPFFARTLVNRYWKHFLGRGLVDPEDDLRVTNPASNPALLDALARHFVAHHYDLKDLVRTICSAQVYRLSALPNRHNAEDRQNYSRFYPRRLNAEVLLDAIDTVTGSRTAFRGAPLGTRAVQLPDNQFESYFLSVFGRPDAASPCECERNSGSSLAQALHMYNSEEIQLKISGKGFVAPAQGERKEGKKKGKKTKGQAPPLSGSFGGRLKELLADRRPHEERLRDLYLVALSREPTREETAALIAYLDEKKDVSSAYADILWALINTKEFLFNH